MAEVLQDRHVSVSGREVSIARGNVGGNSDAQRTDPIATIFPALGAGRPYRVDGDSGGSSDVASALFYKLCRIQSSDM